MAYLAYSHNRAIIHLLQLEQEVFELAQGDSVKTTVVVLVSSAAWLTAEQTGVVSWLAKYRVTVGFEQALEALVPDGSQCVVELRDVLVAGHHVSL